MCGQCYLSYANGQFQHGNLCSTKSSTVRAKRYHFMGAVIFADCERKSKYSTILLYSFGSDLPGSISDVFTVMVLSLKKA